MVAYWEPGVQYNLGDSVKYEGHTYNIIQAHRSQSDWAPTVAFALWGRVPEQECKDEHWSKTDTEKPYGNYGSEQNKPPPPQGGYQMGDHQITHEDQQKPYSALPEEKKQAVDEEHKRWYENIPEDKKKDLEIGGGVALALGALGAGFFAYKHHEKKSEEEQKEALWALQNWLQDSKRRTDYFRANGSNEPCTWILNVGRNMPDHAIECGFEDGKPLYTVRVCMDGGIQLGKGSPVFKKGGVIGYKQEENHVDQYEILVGDMRRLKWVGVSGAMNIDESGYLHVGDSRVKPVEGGRENDNPPTILYVAKASHKGAVHPGKTSRTLKAAYIPYGGKEKKVEDYEVLCYA